jgi:hypothetical protein
MTFWDWDDRVIGAAMGVIGICLVVMVATLILQLCGVVS